MRFPRIHTIYKPLLHGKHVKKNPLFHKCLWPGLYYITSGDVLQLAPTGCILFHQPEREIIKKIPLYGQRGGKLGHWKRTILKTPDATVTWEIEWACLEHCHPCLGVNVYSHRTSKVPIPQNGTNLGQLPNGDIMRHPPPPIKSYNWP